MQWVYGNLIKICRLERFQLKAWVFRAPTQHFYHGLLLSVIVYLELALITMSVNIHFIVAAGKPPSCSTHVNVKLDPFNTVMYGIGVVMFGVMSDTIEHKRFRNNRMFNNSGPQK